MTAIAGSVLFVVFVWWFSTGAVLLLARLEQWTHRWSFAAATLVMAGCVAGLVISSAELTTRNVVISFCCVIGIWAWHEMAFLFGYITGPRKTACPEGSAGWVRFGLAFNTLKHHELALLATLMIVVGATWNGAHLHGLAAFAILWLMRISAKLNIFFGVPHFSDELLPPHLRHLSSYFNVAPVGPFFVVTLLISSLVASGLIGIIAAGPDLGAAHTAGLVMLVSLLLLAIVEHGFMALPVRDAVLWQWAMIETTVQPRPQPDLLPETGRTPVCHQLGTHRMTEAPLVGAAAECASVGGLKNGL